MHTQTWSTIETKHLVPVTTVNNAEEGLRVAEALVEGGLPVIEVTLRTPGAEAALEAITSRFPEMVVGAGTVLDADRVERLKDIGVHFIVSPGLNPKVVEAVHAAGLPITPGVMTPSEVEQARSLGCKVLKFFPAEAAGGVPMLKALAGPYGHTGLRFIPTGGINVSLAASYLELDSVIAVGGSWFVAPKLIADGDYRMITNLTVEALRRSQKVRDSE